MADPNDPAEFDAAVSSRPTAGQREEGTFTTGARSLDREAESTARDEKLHNYIRRLIEEGDAVELADLLRLAEKKRPDGEGLDAHALIQSARAGIVEIAGNAGKRESARLKLVSAFDDSTDPLTKLKRAQALMVIEPGNEKAFSHLKHEVCDPSGDVRRQAMTALAWSERPDATALLKNLATTDACGAILALRECRNRQAKDAIFSIYENTTEDNVAKEASWALAESYKECPDQLDRLLFHTLRHQTFWSKHAQDEVRRRLLHRSDDPDDWPHILAVMCTPVAGERAPARMQRIHSAADWMIRLAPDTDEVRPAISEIKKENPDGDIRAAAERILVGLDARLRQPSRLEGEVEQSALAPLEFAPASCETQPVPTQVPIQQHVTTDLADANSPAIGAPDVAANRQPTKPATSAEADVALGAAPSLPTLKNLPAGIRSVVGMFVGTVLQHASKQPVIIPYLLRTLDWMSAKLIAIRQASAPVPVSSEPSQTQTVQYEPAQGTAHVTPAEYQAITPTANATPKDARRAGLSKPSEERDMGTREAAKFMNLSHSRVSQLHKDGYGAKDEQGKALYSFGAKDTKGKPRFSEADCFQYQEYVRNHATANLKAIATEHPLTRPVAKFSVEEVAEMLHMAPQTVRYHCQKGNIVAERIGKRSFAITQDAIDAFRLMNPDDRRRRGPKARFRGAG